MCVAHSVPYHVRVRVVGGSRGSRTLPCRGCGPTVHDLGTVVPTFGT